MKSVADLGVSRRVVRILGLRGIETVDELCALNERELLAVPGVGGGALAELVPALQACGRGLKADEFAPYVCARHGAPAWDASLANLFLCDDCSSQWQSIAFDGQRPLYVGEATRGYCLNCNLLLEDVRLRQWFLCGTCERVARSIGRSVVAERFLAEEWEKRIAPIAPYLLLKNADVPTLRRRQRDASSTKVAAIDFEAEDTRTSRNVFGIELKTGKSYISGHAQPGTRMSEFQLDTTDCDDITTVMTREGAPAYLFHVQVIDRASPPTLQYRALGAWWTDVFQMRPHLRRIQRRPRETRDAAYFDTAMFGDMDSFVEHVRSGGHLRMVERFDREGVPLLYVR